MADVPANNIVELAFKVLDDPTYEISDDQQQLLNGSNLSVEGILHVYLGIIPGKEIYGRKLVMAYLEHHYARLRAQFDVASSRISKESDDASWETLEEIAMELAKHPFILRHTGQLTYDYSNRRFVENDLYEKLVKERAHRYILSVYNNLE